MAELPSARPARRLGRTEIRQLLDEHGVRPTSSLGQNFVTDPNTVERIARLAGIGPGDHVLEIGPGLGSLTLARADTGAEVTALEIDDRLVAALAGIVPASVRVVAGDALRVDWSQLLAEPPGAAWALVANLPYSVATTLVIDVLERVPAIGRMLVMVQREVAERLAASPGGRGYGAVSVRVSYFASARLLGKVSAEVFHPRPKVESALVAVDRRAGPAVAAEVAGYAEIVSLVRAGFAGRRKMLRRSLAGIVDEASFACAGIAPTARAEELGVGEWGMLASCQRRIESAPPGRGGHPSTTTTTTGEQAPASGSGPPPS